MGEQPAQQPLLQALGFLAGEAGGQLRCNNVDAAGRASSDFERGLPLGFYGLLYEKDAVARGEATHEVLWTLVYEVPAEVRQAYESICLARSLSRVVYYSNT